MGKRVLVVGGVAGGASAAFSGGSAALSAAFSGAALSFSGAALSFSGAALSAPCRPFFSALSASALSA